MEDDDLPYGGVGVSLTCIGAFPFPALANSLLSLRKERPKGGLVVVFGDRSRVRNTSDHLEAVAQGDEEATVESALGELR